MLSSLSYAAKMKLTTQGTMLATSTITGHERITDFARILYSHPSIKLAKLMIEPPVPHEPKLTLIMVITLSYCVRLLVWSLQAVHILLRTGLKEQSLRLLEVQYFD